MRRALLLTILVGLLTPAATVAAPRVPFGFFGMTVDGPLFREDLDQAGEFRRMAKAGVESAIAEINWNFLQPHENAPPDFTRIDRVVGNAARRGIRVMGHVLYSPRWAAVDPNNGASPPRPGPYATFVRELVLRYGPDGAYWRAHPRLPKLPIRDWQIWNEPAGTGFWSIQPFEKRYVELLRYARFAIKVTDPGARVVLAGLTFKSWEDLRRIYRAGGGGLFDAVSLHPYTQRPQDILYIVKLNREVMARNDDAELPVLITEMGWPSAKGRSTDNYGYEQTEAGQAAKIREAMPILANGRKRWGIERVYWYSWLSVDRGPFTFGYSGLRTLRGDGPRDKPALAAYRRTVLALEGCMRKGATAARCG